MGQNESKTMTLHKMNLNDYCSHSLNKGGFFAWQALNCVLEYEYY